MTNKNCKKSVREFSLFDITGYGTRKMIETIAKEINGSTIYNLRLHASDCGGDNCIMILTTDYDFEDGMTEDEIKEKVVGMFMHMLVYEFYKKIR